jgi:hypothetical protein
LGWRGRFYDKAGEWTLTLPEFKVAIDDGEDRNVAGPWVFRFTMP